MGTKSTLAVAAAGLAFGMIAAPVAVFAATGTLTNIVDPVNTAEQARVEGGKLRVGDGAGNLTVDGEVRTSSSLKTLSGQIAMPNSIRNVTLNLRAPACTAPAAFHIEQLSVQPSPDSEPSGNDFTAYQQSYGASVPLTQPLSNGSSRISQLSVASNGGTGQNMARLDMTASIPGGLPAALNGGLIPVNVKLTAAEGNNTPHKYNVHVSGRCLAPTVMPA